jgi:hypothetical protein
MKNLTTAIFVFLFGISIFAQTSNKTSEVKFFQGDENMPYIFEPYNADYAIDAKLLGVNFNLFKYQTQLIELKEGWSEIQNWQVPQIESFKPDSLKITQEIDLKTGLLQKMLLEGSGETDGEYITAKQEIFLTDGKYVSNAVATNAKGKVKETENFSFPLNEKIYPCQSNTFFSYLPLNDNFIGSFTCLVGTIGNDLETGSTHDYGDNSTTYSRRNYFKDNVSLQKQTIKVVGSETITTKAGTFDCWKIKQNSDSIGEYTMKGKFKPSKKNYVSKDFNEKEIMKDFYGSCWIDKKTRKVVKAGFQYKQFGGLFIELQPQKNVNL